MELETALETRHELPLTHAPELAKFDAHGIVTVAPDTVRWFKNAAKSLAAHTGDICITRITPRDIHAWLEAHIENGTKAVTINTHLRGLKTMWSRLTAAGYTGQNPAEPVKYLPEPKKGPKAISHENYQRMLAAAQNKRDIAILATLWGTGCRLGGLISMDVTKIDYWQMNGEHCYAIFVTEKGRKSRHVYLKGLEADLLANWLHIRPAAQTPALFLTQQRSRFSQGGLIHVMRRLKHAAGINGEPANAHAFRHAFAIRMLDEGYDLASVSQWLGHHSPEFTAAVYCVRSEQQLRERYFQPPTNNL